MEQQSSGKTIIITGAAGNLGTEVCRYFLSKGHRIIATVRKEADKKDLPPHASLTAEVVDLSNEAATAAFVAHTIQSHKKIDGALMLAGGFAMGKISETSAGAILQQIQLNFETAYHLTRPLLEHMLLNKTGRLVFIGARPALQASYGKNMIAYGLSKSLLFRLAEFINAEAKGTNVTATVLAPSTIDTEANRKSMPEADPGNWVKPEELAAIMEFVISDQSLRETVLKVFNNA